MTTGTYVALRQDDERHRLVICDERDLVGPHLDRERQPPVRLIDLGQLEHDVVLAEPGCAPPEAGKLHSLGVTA